MSDESQLDSIGRPRVIRLHAPQDGEVPVADPEQPRASRKVVAALHEAVAQAEVIEASDVLVVLIGGNGQWTSAMVGESRLAVLGAMEIVKAAIAADANQR